MLGGERGGGVEAQSTGDWLSELLDHHMHRWLPACASTFDQAMIEVANVGRKATADDHHSANCGISLLPIFDIDVSGIKLTWFTDCTY
jgi:hypothetical protein